MNKITQHIEQLKIKTRKEKGDGYDFAYDECIEVVNNNMPINVRWKKATKEDRLKAGKTAKNNMSKFIANLSEDDLKAYHAKRLAKVHLKRYGKIY